MRRARDPLSSSSAGTGTVHAKHCPQRADGLGSETGYISNIESLPADLLGNKLVCVPLPPPSAASSATIVNLTQQTDRLICSGGSRRVGHPSARRGTGRSEMQEEFQSFEWMLRSYRLLNVNNRRIDRVQTRYLPLQSAIERASPLSWGRRAMNSPGFHTLGYRSNTS